MGLRMATPWKHPATGAYYLRERVPTDLVATVKGRKITLSVGGQARAVTLGDMVKVSLGTKDDRTARTLYREVAATVQETWQRFRQEVATGPVRLTHKQVAALAGQYYRELVSAHEDNPGPSEQWVTLGGVAEELTQSPLRTLENAWGEDADRLLYAAGLTADDLSRRRLLEGIGDAARKASGLLWMRSKRDYSPDPHAHTFPELPCLTTAKDVPHSGETVTLTDLFKLWEADHLLGGGGSAKTVKDFRRCIDSLTAFVGHQDAQRITPREVSDWCDHLLHNEELSPKTVNGKYLVAVKRVFTIGKRRFRITDNPTDGVVVEVKKTKRERSKSFTDEEAKSILRAALRPPETLGGMTDDNKRAIRWGPWLAAYTGARIGELMQLRKQDVGVEDGVPFLRITPEAGSTKTGNFRVVPLHPHLVEMGFLVMTQGRAEGPLFYTSRTGDDPTVRAGNVGKKVSQWVREVVGIADDRIQPNHAWRHRFKTVAREVGVPPEYIDAIQGHEDGRAATGHGEFTVRLLSGEVGKLPRHSVD